MMGFFGLHLEVRHVTLASGSLAAAAMHFEVQSFMMPEFWYATLGIVIIGTLNVGVSFALAFLVAIRARDVQAPQRQLIYSALWKRLKANPKLLFYPPPKAKVGAALAEQEKPNP